MPGEASAETFRVTSPIDGLLLSWSITIVSVKTSPTSDVNDRTRLLSVFSNVGDDAHVICPVAESTANCAASVPDKLNVPLLPETPLEPCMKAASSALNEP